MSACLVQRGLLVLSLGLVGCSGGSSDSPPPEPLPTVNLSASAESAKTFDQVTLEWSSTNATGCTASGGWDGSKSTSGEEKVDLSEGENTFEISCSGAGGSASRTVSVEGIAACMHPDTLDGIVVSDLNELRDQLTLAEGDGRDTVIYVNGGKYEVTEEIEYDGKGSLNRISLIGCGSADVIFDGMGTSRVFHFYYDGLPTDPIPDGPEASLPTLHLEGLSVINGYCYAPRWPAGDGTTGLEGCKGTAGAGGVHTSGMNLYLNDTVFSGNYSNWDAVAISGRHTWVEDSRFTENEWGGNRMQGTIGHSWGALGIYGSLTLNNSVFENNEIDRALWFRPVGGPCDEIYIRVNNSRFSNNLGVGLYILEPSCNGFQPDNDLPNLIEVKNTTFEGNGMMAIMTRGGNTLIEDSVFRMNSNGFHPAANQECDAYFYSGQGATGENDTGHDWDCYFAAGIGVDKYSPGHGTLRVVNTQFIDNNSKDFGGAINISGSVRCDESDYDRYTEGCDRLSTSDQNRIPEYDLEVVNSLFQGNISHRGAAISISRIALARNSYQLGNVKITNSQFIDNKGEWGSAPEGWAGGNEDTETSIIVTGGDLNIESTTFDGNTADITLQVKGTLTCDDSCDGL
jgi:hypothetical protein